MRAREAQLHVGVFGDDLQKMFPILRAGGSDSATLDNVLELLMLGRPQSLPHAVLMLIPEAWQKHGLMDPTSRRSTSTTPA